MPQSVHGHEVIHLIGTAPKPMSLEQVRVALGERFGGDATFHVCAGDGMSFDKLMGFLLQRGKVVQGADGLFSADTSLMCEHD